MTVDRRWLWVGGILTIAGGALAVGVPLATLLTLAAVLACPAAMYFGMGMMGRTQGSAEMQGGARALDGQGDTAGGPASLASSSARADPAPAPERAAPSDSEDPIVILKRRLAAGEIPVEEYERLVAVISRSGPDRNASPTGQGASR